MATRIPTSAKGKLDEYEEILQTLAAKALAGRINRREFEREMLKASTDYTLIMFLTGGGDVSNPAAKKWLAKQKAIHRKSTKQLADDIFSGRYSTGDEDG